MRPTQHLPPVRRFIAVRLVPAVVILVGLGAIAAGIGQTRLARASASWPAVEGEIVRSAIDEERATSGTSSASRSITYRPTVVYRYTVAAGTYEGQRISFGEYATSDVDEARAVLARYPRGATVRVFVRPDDAAMAVLEPGSAGLPWLFAAIGAPFVIVGALLAWAAPKLIAPASRAAA